MGCSGSCCSAFTLSSSLERLRKDPTSVLDGEQILAMLIPITPEEAEDRWRRFSDTGMVAHPEREYFRCIHWDEETRLCTDYENRPEMCRAYPYGGQCEHDCGCQADHDQQVAP